MKTTGVVLALQRYVSPDITPAPPAATWADISRYKNHGTITGATWVRLPSRLWVLTLTDSANVITLPACSALNNIAPVTYLAWINPTSDGGGAAGRIFHKSTAAASNLGTRIYLSGTTIVFTVEGATDLVATTAAAAYTLNNWQFVALTWTGGVAYLNATLYNNAALVAWNAGASNNGVAPFDSNALYPQLIGNSGAGTRAFVGSLVLCRIHKVILSPEQIAQIFQAERGWFGV